MYVACTLYNKIFKCNKNIKLPRSLCIWLKSTTYRIVKKTKWTYPFLQINSSNTFTLDLSSTQVLTSGLSKTCTRNQKINLCLLEKKRSGKLFHILLSMSYTAKSHPEINRIFLNWTDFFLISCRKWQWNELLCTCSMLFLVE